MGEIMENKKLKISKKWLQQLAKGLGTPIDVFTSESLQVVLVQKGLIRCRFVVPHILTDGNGNWEVGAIATLMDNVAGATVHSFTGEIKPTLSFNISYYSTAKSQEEVEIEAKAGEQKGNLTEVKTEIRSKQNGQLIASATLWAASIVKNNAATAKASHFWNSLNNSTPTSKL